MVICMVGLVFARMNAFADKAGDAPDDTVISLVWENNRIDVRFAEWNRHAVQIRTVD